MEFIVEDRCSTFVTGCCHLVGLQASIHVTYSLPPGSPALAVFRKTVVFREFLEQQYVLHGTTVVTVHVIFEPYCLGFMQFMAIIYKQPSSKKKPWNKALITRCPPIGLLDVLIYDWKARPDQHGFPLVAWLLFTCKSSLTTIPELGSCQIQNKWTFITLGVKYYKK